MSWRFIKEVVKKSGVTLVGVTCLTGMATSPAVAADRTIATAGAALEYTAYGDKFLIYDTGCDSHPVYFEYEVGNSGVKRVNYSGGCNTSRLYDYNWEENTTVTYRVCRNVQFGGDNCSVRYKDPS